MDHYLCAAVEAHQKLDEIHWGIMYVIAGDAAFEPTYDDVLSDAVRNLIFKSVEAIYELSPRGRHARLNLIWEEFVNTQKQLRAAKCPDPVKPAV